jgi:hypothetical protein
MEFKPAWSEKGNIYHANPAKRLPGGGQSMLNSACRQHLLLRHLSAASHRNHGSVIADYERSKKWLIL